MPEYHYRAEEDACGAMTDQDEVFAQAAAGMEPGYGEGTGQEPAYDTKAGAGSPVKSRMALHNAMAVYSKKQEITMTKKENTRI